MKRLRIEDYEDDKYNNDTIPVSYLYTIGCSLFNGNSARERPLHLIAVFPNRNFLPHCTTQYQENVNCINSVSFKLITSFKVSFAVNHLYKRTFPKLQMKATANYLSHVPWKRMQCVQTHIYTVSAQIWSLNRFIPFESNKKIVNSNVLIYWCNSW